MAINSTNNESMMYSTSEDWTIDLSSEYSSEEVDEAAPSRMQQVKEVASSVWNNTRKILSAVDVVLVLTGSSANLLDQTGVANCVNVEDCVNNIQTGTHIAMGAKAAAEGKFSLDMSLLANGSYKEKAGLGKSWAFAATCLSTGLQIGSAAAYAAGGGTGPLAVVSAACDTGAIPLQKAVKDSALLYSYYAGFKNTQDPENQQEQFEKQVEQGKYLLKGGIKAVKLGSAALNMALPALGISTVLSAPLAVLGIGAACADAYMTYKDFRKS